MEKVSLFLIALFAPLPAHAFNSILFMDPNFQAWVFVQVPLTLALLITLATSPFCTQRPIPFLRLCFLQIRAIYGTALIAAVVGLLMWDTLAQAEHPLVAWMAIAYGLFCLIWFSYRAASKLIAPASTAKKLSILAIISLLCMLCFLYIKHRIGL